MSIDSDVVRWFSLSMRVKIWLNFVLVYLLLCYLSTQVLRTLVHLGFVLFAHIDQWMNHLRSYLFFRRNLNDFMELNRKKRVKNQIKAGGKQNNWKPQQLTSKYMIYCGVFSAHESRWWILCVNNIIGIIQLNVPVSPSL